MFNLSRLLWLQN